jgi:MFS family permease
VVLVIMAIAFGAPWITLVALKDIAAEVNGERSVPALASALMWIGSGVGGILMGRIAERLGIRFTVIFGAVMVAVGLVFALQMTAIFTCCIPMSMPQAHLVALCSDLGIKAAHGAAMVSVLLGAAFSPGNFGASFRTASAASTRCFSDPPARPSACWPFS